MISNKTLRFPLVLVGLAAAGCASQDPWLCPRDPQGRAETACAANCEPAAVAAEPKPAEMSEMRAAVTSLAPASAPMTVSTTVTVASPSSDAESLDSLKAREKTLADDYYAHNDFSIRTVNMMVDESENGHAHCQHLFLGTSVTIPVHEGVPRLGRWQSCFLVELDHARRREVTVQVLGARSPR